MSREIKFRALDKENKMIYGLVSSRHCTVKGIVESYYFTEISQDGSQSCGNVVKAKTIGQYTGLKDKNGVEIYEGDIVKCDYLIGVVEYGKYTGMFFVTNKKDRESISFFDIHLGSIKVEVIGNIYENPELLEVEHA